MYAARSTSRTLVVTEHSRRRMSPTRKAFISRTHCGSSLSWRSIPIPSTFRIARPSERSVQRGKVISSCSQRCVELALRLPKAQWGALALTRQALRPSPPSVFLVLHRSHVAPRPSCPLSMAGLFFVALLAGAVILRAAAHGDERFCRCLFGHTTGTLSEIG